LTSMRALRSSWAISPWGEKIDFSVLKDQFVDKCLEQIVDVVATEVRVAIGRKNLEDIAVSGGDKLENGNIEGPAAEIVDSALPRCFWWQAVGERGRSRFVDKAKNFEAGDFARVLGGLALAIIESTRGRVMTARSTSSPK